MHNTSYNVVMQTPLGDRHGTMQVHCDEADLSGTLQLLGFRVPFQGTVDAMGSCTINGRIQTLMKSFAYEAHGSINAQQVQLDLQSDGRHFLLSGQVSEGYL